MAQAVLFAEIVPSTKGVKRSIEKDLGGSFDTVEKKGTSVFSKIGGLVKGIGLAAAGAAATITGLAVKGGFERMLKIEDATAKLKGLGHETQTIETIMTDALASVKGTAFGLDTAATVAATAVAAGIKPGQELEKYLRLTADAATIAGVSMEEMGSILNKATTAGKVYTQELNQLADRGLPIFTWLQEEYGVTAEALRKMVSDGKVDAETFRKVIEENIGGAALASGDTTRGAFANMNAALARTGEALLQDVFPYFKTAFVGITEYLDDLNAKIGPFGDKVSAVFDAIVNRDFTGLFDAGVNIEPLLPLFDVLGKLGEVASYFSPIGATLKVLGPVFTDLQGPVMGLLATLGDLAGDVLPVLATVFDVIAQHLVTGLSTSLPVIAELFLAVANAVSGILPVLLPLIGTISGVVMSVFTALWPIIAQVVDIFIALLPPVMQIIEAVLGLISPILELIAPLLDLVMLGVQPLITVLGALLPPIASVVAAIVENFTPVVESILDVLGGVIDFIVGVFTGDWERAWDGIVGIFSGIWNGIVSIVEGVVNNVIALINGIIGGINDIGGAIGINIGLIPNVNFSGVKLAKGALVEQTMGGVPAVIGEGRYDEAVLPLGGPQLDRIREALLGGDGNRSNPNGDDSSDPSDAFIDKLARSIAKYSRTETRMGVA